MNHIKLVLASVTIFFIYMIWLIGSLTNWFRYALSLEANFALILFLVFAFLTITIHFLAIFRFRGSLLFRYAALLSTFIGIGAGMFFTYKASGYYFPSRDFNHVERNESQSLIINGKYINYYLELKNPYSITHKEYLVFSSGGREERIPIPLFQEGMVVYFSSITPEDWCLLEKN